MLSNINTIDNLKQTMQTSQACLSNFPSVLLAKETQDEVGISSAASCAHNGDVLALILIVSLVETLGSDLQSANNEERHGRPASKQRYQVQENQQTYDDVVNNHHSIARESFDDWRNKQNQDGLLGDGKFSKRSKAGSNGIIEAKGTKDQGRLTLLGEILRRAPVRCGAVARLRPIDWRRPAVGSGEEKSPMLPFFRTNPSSRTPKRFTQWLEHVRELWLLWLRSPLSQQPPSDLDLQILRALQPKNREVWE
ncbi:hypothetical protein OPV22_027940 [Ensete ventricosum]|uniref:Uncharacterized protein n=1 Tax=Ensete ventricosum TaxID=4639 RepID=A0AAV8Q515_ENSVE|nr:hypothetical protein OPV22_027940 [Ensete ventricosum]